jgi:hypothetical protein
METNNTDQGSSLLPVGAPKERRNLHIQAMVNWMVAANGGHLPAPGKPDRAIDSLMDSISNITLDSLKASIPEDVKGQVSSNFNQLTEDALRAIVLDAAKLSLADHAPPQPNLDRVFWLCNVCGQATCVCVPGTVEHEYDPFCMRNDCSCRNQLPKQEDIITSTFGSRLSQEEDVVMCTVEE